MDHLLVFSSSFCFLFLIWISNHAIYFQLLRRRQAPETKGGSLALYIRILKCNINGTVPSLVAGEFCHAAPANDWCECHKLASSLKTENKGSSLQHCNARIVRCVTA